MTTTQSLQQFYKVANSYEVSQWYFYFLDWFIHKDVVVHEGTHVCEITPKYCQNPRNQS